jgi:hypothetical protein
VRNWVTEPPLNFNRRRDIPTYGVSSIAADDQRRDETLEPAAVEVRRTEHV